MTLQTIPPEIVCADDYQRRAEALLPAATFAHIAGGAGGEGTLRANTAAFETVSIYNRVLADCTQGSTRLSLLGQAFRHPILLAPVAHQALVHPDAEIATARGADATDTGMVVSTLSSRSLEEIARAAPGPKWFQLYFQRTRAATLDLLRRAEACGYGAIVVTLDAPVQPRSRRAARAGFVLEDVPANLAPHETIAPVALTPAQSIIFQGFMREAPQWSDLEWLCAQSSLPVIAKGVTHPDDAARAVEAGAAGVVVSNHGGRALDSAPAALLALPAVRARLGESACVLMDGGVRSGADVFKAIALGANAVLIGRPQVFALAVAGALGVAHMLKMMREELEICMALAGCPTIASISPAALVGKAS